MCPELPNNKAFVKQSEGTSTYQKDNGVNKDQILVNKTAVHVCLQVVRLVLNSQHSSKVVRALLDTGSHRSYILKSTAVQLGFTPKKTEKITHCVFGGSESLAVHNFYDITVTHGDFSLTFEVLDQDMICGDVSPMFSGEWVQELEELGIEISDLREPGPIEVLWELTLQHISTQVL